MGELNKYRELVEKKFSEEDKRRLGLVRENKDVRDKKMRELIEMDIASSVTFSPLTKMIDQRTLFPWTGKESDGEIAFNFERMEDAQNIYDFVVGSGMLKPGEVKLNISEHQFSVHFMPHVIVTKPEVIQSTLLAYQDFVQDGYEETVESIANMAGDIIMERTKISGAPKGRAKGNPFHDDGGWFSGPDQIASGGYGSFSSGKVKLRFAGKKKSKKGDLVVNFGTTKRPCGRAARAKGQNVRCMDGKKGITADVEYLATVIEKQRDFGFFNDNDAKNADIAIDRIKKISRLIESGEIDIDIEQTGIDEKPTKMSELLRSMDEGMDDIPQGYESKKVKSNVKRVGYGKNSGGLEFYIDDKIYDDYMKDYIGSVEPGIERSTEYLIKAGYSEDDVSSVFDAAKNAKDFKGTTLQKPVKIKFTILKRKR